MVRAVPGGAPFRLLPKQPRLELADFPAGRFEFLRQFGFPFGRAGMHRPPVAHFLLQSGGFPPQSGVFLVQPRNLPQTNWFTGFVLFGLTSPSTAGNGFGECTPPNWRNPLLRKQLRGGRDIWHTYCPFPFLHSAPWVLIIDKVAFLLALPPRVREGYSPLETVTCKKTVLQLRR